MPYQAPYRGPEPPMRDPEWLVLDSDGDFACTVRAPDLDAAVIAARLELGAAPDEETGCTVEPVTEEIRRAWRNSARRERYAERREAGTIPGRGRPSTVPVPWAVFMHAFDMEAGRYRCANGHFCHPDDLVDSPTGARIGGACVDFAPTCRRCRARTNPALEAR